MGSDTLVSDPVFYCPDGRRFPSGAGGHAYKPSRCQIVVVGPA